MSERQASRRQANANATVSKTKGALEALRAAREGDGGKKRIANLSVREEARVYDEVDEEAYVQLVAKRREEADFIVDDEGQGYVDIGQEDNFWRQQAEGEDASDDEEEGKPGAAKKRKGDAAGKEGGGKGSKRRTGEAGEAVPEAGRIQTLFAKAHKHAAAAPPRVAVSNTASDDLLSDILGDMGGAPPPAAPLAAGAARGAAPSARPPMQSANRVAARAPPAGRPASNLGRPTNGSAAPRPTLPRPLPKHVMQPMKEEQGMVEDDPMPTYDDAYAGAGDHEGPAAVDDSAMEVDDGDAAAHQDGGAAKPQAPADAAVKSEAPAAAKPPSRMFAEVAATLAEETSRPATGWQEMMDGSVEEQEEEGVGELKAEAPAAAAAGAADEAGGAALDVDANGLLPFFLLDAHEMDARPGEVYLFGKVKQGGQWQSCCCVVRGLHRSLLVVPNDGVFNNLGPEEEEELESLEAAAKEDPSQKVALIKYLQVRCAEVRSELGEVLSRLGVRNRRVVPVRRNYAFENPDVPHGEQYVLKVRYPASESALPHGTRGRTFRAVFGMQQSALEALMLKRRVRGPCWLLLRAPKRVDYANQASWCKLEVALEGSKGILSCAVLPGVTGAAATGPSSKLSTQDVAALLALSKQPAPPLTVASIHLTTIIHPTTHQHEVVAASVLHLAGAAAEAPMTQAAWGAKLRNFSVVRKMDGRPWPADFEQLAATANKSARGRANGGTMVTLQANERLLLTCLLARLQALDADVLVGHNIAAFDLTVLLHRMQHHKVPLWSRIGRLKRKEFPKFTGGGQTFGGGAGAGVMGTTAGRLLCDTYLTARELLREVDYTLRTLSSSQLGQVRADLAPADVPAQYGSGQGLLQMLHHGESDAWLTLGLMFHLSVLPLTKQLSNLSGSLWGKTLAGQRAQRIEMLLLHEFHGRKFICPDKLTLRDKDRLKAQREQQEQDDDGGDGEDGEGGGGGKKGAANSKGPQYAGGLVLEPKKGLYDKFVIVLDFNSLYPSIIQEYNICFTTVHRPKDGGMAPLPEPSTGGLAPLPTVIQGLVQRRKQVKSQMASARDPVQRQQLDIQQQAIKLTANSMYGCLGFGASRFFAKPLAEMITSQGRSILQSTVDLVQGTIGANVIYGDTDSIMIYTGTDDLTAARELGGRVKKEVNRRYKLLEIELDGVFKCMLLLKKKKYAAIKVETGRNGQTTETTERKGLDIVRRDWSPLCKDVGNYVLNQLLSGRPREDVVMDIHAHLREVKDSILGGHVPLAKFIITKQLTKRIEDYPDAKSQPHVQVAMRRRAAGKQAIMPGETVPYVICIERPAEPEPSTSAPSAAGAGAAASPGPASGSAAGVSGTPGTALKAGSAPSEEGGAYGSGAAPAAVVANGGGPAAKGGAPGKAAAAGSGAGGSKAGSLADRARHPDELAENPRLSVDVEYYLANQVHPVVSRLLAPIEGTDAAHVAECLGLDSHRFRAPTEVAAEEELLMASGSVLDDEETFRACEPLMLTAPNGTSFEFRGAADVVRGTLPAECLLTPPDAVGDPTSTLSEVQLCNQVVLRSREVVARYYDGWMEADDELARVDTRNVCLAPSGEADRSTHPDPARRGVLLRRRMTERQLYLQLSHFHRLLNVDAALKRTHVQLQAAAGPKTRVLEADLAARVEPLRRVLAAAAAAVAAVRTSSGYNWVHMGQLLAPLREVAHAQ